MTSIRCDLIGGLALFLFAGTSVASPRLESKLTKDGVTWTFDHPVLAGEFVNGDYYVVGPVTVVAISPVPQTASPYMNGSVKNLPTSNGRSGFDQRLNDGDDQKGWFDPKWRAYPPIALVPGDALVSAISVPQERYHKIPEVMRAEDHSCSPVASVSILTVLGAPVPADAFRPSYCDRKQTIHHANRLRRDLLPALAPPKPGLVPALAQFEAWFRRPWIDLSPFLFDAPAEYMPSYGAHIAQADAYAVLLLSLNFPPGQKVALTNYFVQYGIDLFGCLQAGHNWPALGGHRSGRKLPIVLAGILLGDDAMQKVSALHPDSFGEDMQTVYINQIPPKGTFQKAWQGATVVYGGHYGVHEDGTPLQVGLYGPYEQLQPKDWPILDPPREQLGEAYRRCCTSIPWVGEALALHLIGADRVWNHPAFFDYVDRWMREDDSDSVAEVKKQSGYDYSVAWDRQRQTTLAMEGNFPQSSFVDDMWRAYRDAPARTAPVIVSGRAASAQVGKAFRFRINAVHAPDSYDASSLPAGFSIDAENGVISGTPASPGTYRVKLTAKNAAGAGAGILELKIER